MADWGENVYHVVTKNVLLWGWFGRGHNGDMEIRLFSHWVKS
jgi:hypothetical protein